MAGVVEDAEESLQVVPTDNAGPRNLDGSSGSATDGSSSVGSGQNGRGASTASSDRSTRGLRQGTQSGTGSPGSPSGTSPGASETPSAAEREVVERRKARDSVDNTLSVVGVLVLLALIVAAGVYSKHAGRDD